MHPALLTALLALAPAGPAVPATVRTLAVQVVAVADGDTITVLDSSQRQHRIRLAGIDAPEKGQDFGEQSRQALAGWVYGKRVTIEWSASDRHGRILARVWTLPPGDCAAPCADRVDVNLAQVGAGMAWHYRQYEAQQQPADREAYSAAERQARSRALGIWSQPDPVAPWSWRAGVNDGASGSAVRKSRNGICHAPGMGSWSTVRHFTTFATLEECIDSGGRLPRGNRPRE